METFFQIINFLYGGLLFLLTLKFAIRITHPELVVEYRKYFNSIWVIPFVTENQIKPKHYDRFKLDNSLLWLAVFVGLFTKIWFVFLGMTLLRVLFTTLPYESKWHVRLEYLLLCGLIAFAGVYFIHGI
jgi:hypothetical protein